MQFLFKRLRGLGPIGGHLADGLSLLLNNWVLTMSTAAGLWASLTDSVVTFAENPRTHTAILVFLTVLWTSVGITYLIDRRRPRAIRPEHDYRYGLTFENLTPAINGPDFANDERELRFAIHLRNFSSGPMKYSFDEFDVRIANRAIPVMKKGTLIGFMARGSGRMSVSGSFKRGDFREFFGKEIKGTIIAKISYGHPEREPVRQLFLSLEIVMEIHEDGPLGFGHHIIEEVDKEFP